MQSRYVIIKIKVNHLGIGDLPYPRVWAKAAIVFWMIKTGAVSRFRYQSKKDFFFFFFLITQSKRVTSYDIYDDSNKHKQVISFSLLLLMIVSLLVLLVMSRIHLWVKMNISNLLLSCCITISITVFPQQKIVSLLFDLISRIIIWLLFFNILMYICMNYKLANHYIL